MKKILAMLLIVVGIGTMLYPSATQYYSDYEQEKLMEKWENGEDFGYDVPKERNSQEAAVQDYEELQDAFNSENEGLVKKVSAATVKQPAKKNSPKKKTAMIATIEIEKIGVKLPILEGASKKNLKIAAAHLTGTAMPGEPGNAAIAAHRSRKYGKMFNRLSEVQKGDVILVKDRGHSYRYVVDSKRIVKPQNTKVLEGNGKDKTLTLITCTPNGKKRVIVKASSI